MLYKTTLSYVVPPCRIRDRPFTYGLLVLVLLFALRTCSRSSILPVGRFYSSLATRSLPVAVCASFVACVA
eukprot:scaffold214550_cov41-Tisochrysis_lutea.AAC.1